MAEPSTHKLPKPRTLLGWGALAAATAFVKEKYTDLSWGDVARAPVQGILDAYSDTKTSGWQKAWNVAVETTKLGVGIGLMVGATALATAAAPAVAGTVAGSAAIAVGSLIVGGALSYFVADPLLDKAKSKPPEHKAENKPNPSPAPSYAAMVDERKQVEPTLPGPDAVPPASRATFAALPRAPHYP